MTLPSIDETSSTTTTTATRPATGASAVVNHENESVPVNNHITTNENDITEEISQRICDHMNHDHYVTVYAMAKYSVFYKKRLRKFSISHVKMKQITSISCIMSVTLCSKDVCEMMTIQYPLFPSIQYGTNELRLRLIMIHHKVLHPYDMLSHQLSFGKLYAVFFVMFLLTILTFFCTYEQRFTLFYNIYESSSYLMMKLSPTIVSMIAQHIPTLFWFTLIGHIIQADIVVYYSRRYFKLSWKTCILWFLCISCFGTIAFLPMFDIIQQYRRRPPPLQRSIPKSDTPSDKKKRR